jgi:hypothetical protein
VKVLFDTNVALDVLTRALALDFADFEDLELNEAVDFYEVGSDGL